MPSRRTGVRRAQHLSTRALMRHAPVIAVYILNQSPGHSEASATAWRQSAILRIIEPSAGAHGTNGPVQFFLLSSHEIRRGLRQSGPLPAWRERVEKKRRARKFHLCPGPVADKVAAGRHTGQSLFWLWPNARPARMVIRESHEDQITQSQMSSFAILARKAAGAPVSA